MTLETLRPPHYLDADPSSCDLLSFAAGKGHREFPCLSRSHNPASCVPCLDFSPWVRERVLRHEVDGLGEYLWRIRRATSGLTGGPEEIRDEYTDFARAIMAAPLGRYLQDGTAEAYLDLRVTLVLLAAHEGFSGFIMAGQAAEFAAAVMAPHGFGLTRGATLVNRRNDFVRELGQEMDYWTLWAPLALDSVHSPLPPQDFGFQNLLRALSNLPLGARAHAVDALRHLSANPDVPRSLASLSRPETQRWGLDVADSSCLILASGLVAPATDAGAWVNGWTRRDLLGFLSESGVRAPKSWNKERLAELAIADCAEGLHGRMASSGAVELTAGHAAAASRLIAYIENVTETWRVWLGFGTGVGEVRSKK